MSTSDNITDDYVASILKRDAEKKGQSRLFASGLSSLLSGRTRPRGDAPRPNQRFLKNLVRDVDSHNAALKAKEEEDAARRMRDLSRGKEAERSRKKREHDREGNPNRWKNVLGGISGSSQQKEGGRQQNESRRERAGHRSRIRDSRSRSRSRSRSPRRHRHGRERDRDREHERPRKRRRQSSSSPDRPSRRQPLSKRSSRPSPPAKPQSPKHQESASDSDPLASIIGPKPPSKTVARGRGANKSSNIDDRFSASYDPKADVNLSPDDADSDDWDMALEALRDRAKWRKSGAERLRAAGFTEEEVEKWEKGGGTGARDDGEKDVRDVKWSKKGEGREWDRGKVVEGDYVDVKPGWANATQDEGEDMTGRLKGT